MLSKIILALTVLGQEGGEEPPVAAPPPDFGPYTEETADSYEQDGGMNMVWITFKSTFYSNIYYGADGEKKEITEDDPTSISSKYNTLMTKLAGQIEAKTSKKYYIVFFDSQEYQDHAIEGLGCKNVVEASCISVLLPLGEGKPEDMEDEPEVIYTKEFSVPEILSTEAHMEEILKFVALVEAPGGTEKEQYKFVPADEPEGEPDEGDADSGFGSDDEAPDADAAEDM